MNANGLSITQGVLIGIDEFLKDFETVVSSEAPINQDQLLLEVVERCFENQGSIIGMVLDVDRTKSKKAVSFDFVSGGDESLEEMVILYLDYHEVS